MKIPKPRSPRAWTDEERAAIIRAASDNPKLSNARLAALVSGMIDRSPATIEQFVSKHLSQEVKAARQVAA